MRFNRRWMNTDNCFQIDCMDILKISLKDIIRKDFYSVGKYMEGAACIEKDSAGWIVYEGERGKKHNIRTFTDVSGACYDLISRVSESDEQEEKIKSLFDFVKYSTSNRNRILKGQLPLAWDHMSYDYLDAIKRVKYGTIFQLNDTIEAHISIACNKQQLESICVSPHSIKNKVKVLVFAKDKKAAEAEAAGADYVGGEDIASKIKNDEWLDFDVLVATPDMMDIVSSLDFILKPRGLMPSAQMGTVTMDVARKVTDFKTETVKYRLNKHNIVCVPVGKACFTEETLKQNFNIVINEIIKSEPERARKQYIKDVALASKEGLSVKINIDALGEELCVSG